MAAGVVAAVALASCAACGSTTSESAPGDTAATAASQSAPAGPSDFAGTYAVKYDDGLTRTWTAVSCGPGCSDVTQRPEPEKPSPVAGKARLDGTKWTLKVRQPDAVVCPDGSEHEGLSIWTWDAKTLEGAFNTEQFVDDCSDGMTPVPSNAFTLTRTSGEAEPPGMRTS